MIDSWKESVKDVHDTVGRDKDFRDSPFNLYGDDFFQIETKEEAKFVGVEAKKSSSNQTTVAVAMVAIVLSLVTGLWLGLVITSQQGALEQVNQEVLGVNENLYQYEEGDTSE